MLYAFALALLLLLLLCLILLLLNVQKRHFLILSCARKKHQLVQQEFLLFIYFICQPLCQLYHGMGPPLKG